MADQVGIVPHSSNSRIAECPVCGRVDRTDKASSVVRQNSGTVLVAHAAPSTFETLLGSQLAQPHPPPEPDWAQCATRIALSWILAALIYGAVNLADAFAGFSPPEWIQIAGTVAVIWFGLILPGLRLSRTFQEKTSLPSAGAAWLQAFERWNNLYYCSRDDVCFVEGESESCSPEGLRALLYNSTPASEDITRGLAQNPI